MAGNLEISTVISCKMRCSYCPQDIHIENYASKVKSLPDPRAAFSLTVPNFIKYLSSVPKHVDIVFAGMAEPFLNKECYKMIDHAFYKGHQISVYTTGYNMTLNDALNLRNYTYNHFCLHLPDAEGKMNLKITPQYLEVIKALMPLQNNLMCIGTLHPEVEAVIGRKVADGSHGLFSRAGLLKHLIIPRKKGKLECSACGPDLNHNILLPNGDVLLCCMDYGQQHVIGNLNQVSYDQIFSTEEYKKVKQGFLDEGIDTICRLCEVSKPIK